jgi:SAM-dependent methyltransferase
VSAEGAPGAGTWQWDPSLYSGSAAYYARGRIGYPAELAERLRVELQLDGSGRLLDVGCGPGSLTLLLAPLFEQAIGVDADAGMVAEATRRAAQSGVGNVAWRQLRGEELPADLGRFRVVSFAQSFHWMDRAAVARTVRDMVDGACVHVHATTHRGVDGAAAGPHPAPPWERIEQLVQEFLGSTRRAGAGTLPAGTPGGEADIYRAAGFAGPTRIEIPCGAVSRSVDDIVAAVFSLSSSAPHLFGERHAEFEQRLRQVLAAASPSGWFTERMRELAADVWRPAPGDDRSRP